MTIDLHRRCGLQLSIKFLALSGAIDTVDNLIERTLADIPLLYPLSLMQVGVIVDFKKSIMAAKTALRWGTRASGVL